MGVEPAAPKRGDFLTILSGTSQNVAGIAVAAIAQLLANVLISRTLGESGFGTVTVITQVAFVGSFATRAGMDMAVLRRVAVEAGLGRHERLRAPVARAAAIAGAVSALVAVGMIALAPSIRSLLSLEEDAARAVVQAAAVGLPFLALTNVWLSATRGLKIMRYTLFIFWAGQPLAWILMMVLGWRIDRSPWMSVLAYSLSWAGAALAAWWCWRRESRGWDAAPLRPEELSGMVRYAGPRAPAALFSQLLFWTDLFVLTRYASGPEVGVYSAALRAGQVVVLFLTSVNLMFGPFVADLHNRGETEHLDRLFKSLTRWTLAATLPGFLLLAVAPESVLRMFGDGFATGKAALLVLLGGQLVNIATGSVGFVLIMAGRTGWDLAVYAGALALDLALAFLLCPRYGITGAAIANALTFATSNLARLVLVKNLVGIQPYDRNYGRLLAPTGLALLAMWVVHASVDVRWYADIVVTGVAGLVVYAATYLTVGLTPDERRGARTMIARLRGRERLGGAT